MVRAYVGRDDLLGLSRHPDVLAAARHALDAHGLNGVVGDDEVVRALSALTGCPNIVVFATPWAAWYAAMAALVRRRDHVLLDERAHAGLREAARCATEQLHVVPHAELDAVRSTLSALRRAEPMAGLFVVTEALFPGEARRPDLASLAAMCQQERAALVVDVTHDLGAHGTGGAGTIGQHALVGKVDLIVGGLAKTFAAEGGFLASLFPSIAHFVRTYGAGHCLSSSPSAMQLAVLGAALRLASSAEGEWRRHRLRENAVLLRTILESSGLVCLGEPAGYVPVLAGDEAKARLALSLLQDAGVPVRLLEHPSVPRHAARLCVDLSADESTAQVEAKAQVIADSLHEASALRAGVDCLWG